MWMWGKHGYLRQSLIEKWDEELHRILANAVPEYLIINGTMGAFIARSAIETIVARLEDTDLDIAHLADPFHRYYLNFKVQSIAIYLWDKENWFNHAMAFHTLHFSIDEDLSQSDADTQQESKLAKAAQTMIKKVLSTLAVRFTLPLHLR